MRSNTMIDGFKYPDVLGNYDNETFIRRAADKASEYASKAEECLKGNDYKEATAWATLAVYYQLKKMGTQPSENESL